MIREVIYNRIYNDYSYAPQYYNYSAPYDYDYSYYGSPYSSAYYGSPYDYAYVPQVTYVYVPQYGQVYYDPYSSNYSTYSSYGYPYSSYSSNYYPSYASYGDDYGYDDYGYSDDGYGNDSGYGGLLNNLPIGDLVSGLAGDSFIGELLSGFLTQGYDEGYLAGQYVRDNGYNEEDYYNNPYAVNEASYDMYSVNLAENRRVFSEGYQAGYSDALAARQDDYYPYEDSQPDLISLLIGNTLSGFTGV